MEIPVGNFVWKVSFGNFVWKVLFGNFVWKTDRRTDQPTERLVEAPSRSLKIGIGSQLRIKISQVQRQQSKVQLLPCNIWIDLLRLIYNNENHLSFQNCHVYLDHLTCTNYELNVMYYEDKDSTCLGIFAAKHCQ